MSSNGSDDKSPQRDLQNNQPRRKRRRSKPLAALMKLNPYLAVTVAVTVAMTVAMTVAVTVHFVIENSGNCNGFGNHCGPILIHREVHIDTGGGSAQPQPSPNPPIGSPRQPPEKTQPSPAPTQNPFSNPPTDPPPIDKPVPTVPTQPAAEATSIRATTPADSDGESISTAGI
jgi:hypothetical protein